MYPSAPLYLNLPIQNFFTEVVCHNYDGNLATIEIREDDDAFYVRLRANLKKAHPSLTDAEIDKVIQMQERLADVIFDIWLTKINKKTA